MTPTTLICALTLALYLLRVLIRRVFSVLDNIPGPPRKSLLTGNITQFHDPDGWEFHADLAESYGQVVKIYGLFGDRQLFVFDPVALHTILVKERDTYEEEEQFMCLSGLIFGRGIFSTIRDEHRKYRKMMMPAFSTANLREMLPIFYQVAERGYGLIAPNLLDGPHTLDFNSIISRTSLELIGRAGIGYSFDPMVHGQEQTDRYAQAFRALMPTAFKLGLLLPFLPLVLKIPFPSFHRFMLNLIPSATLHQARDIIDFTNATAAQLVSDRKAAILNGELDANDNAKDLMSILMKGSMSSGDGLHLTDNEMVAAISMILFAGTDTTSSAMNRMFHILALHPDVQDKLRAEILAAPEHMDHETLNSALPYLDAVVREVLRLYPPPGPMSRIAFEDTIIPVSTPIIGVDGTIMNTITVPKGTPIHIAISAANQNKNVWGEDALEFRPERWTNGKADSLTIKLCGVDGSTMTFLGGGRSCIGFKFAQLEMSGSLVHLRQLELKYLAEIVVCVLLRAFKFSSPDPRIKWRMNGLVAAPNVDNQPKLPILVEQLKT
ncbi:cytochrome P450 [Mycena rosella]|uniref:Cytochrome P450 n=1 Tax=Mycena rosella TaxID=1033263 RepID=A0AAD7GVU9_MYCRO|nr:cytochrome P450 [Mycena rosella]